jgi:hypothetical protein
MIEKIFIADENGIMNVTEETLILIRKINEIVNELNKLVEKK